MRLLISLLLIMFTLSVQAEVQIQKRKQSTGKVQERGPSGGEYIERGQEGWFWYDDPIEIEEEPEPEPEPQPEPKKEPKKQEPKEQAPVPPQSSGPPPLSAEWYKMHLEKYRNRAIDNPSPENVRAYLYLQRHMMDKAERFSSVYQQVVVGDPILDETTRYPIAQFAARQQEQKAAEMRHDLIRDMAETSGVFFFFDKDCAACGQQAWVLKQLTARYGMNVVAVSMDGTAIDEKYFPSYLTDQGQAAKMEVQIAPAIVLANPTRNITYPIVQGGLIALDEIESRLLIAAKTTGLLDPDLVDKASSVRGKELLLDAPEGVTEEVLDNPKELVDLFKQQTGIQR